MPEQAQQVDVDDRSGVVSADEAASVNRPLPDRRCPLCQSEAASAQRLIEHDGWVVVQCPDCLMVFLANPPDTASLAQEHAWSESWREENERRQQRAPVARSLHRSLRAGVTKYRPSKWQRMIGTHLAQGSVLDIGCGNGWRMHRCLKQGVVDIVPFGIEVEPSEAAYAHERFAEYGGETRIGAVLPTLGSFDLESMDGALLHAYLEHETEPRGVLQELARVLRPGSPIVIKVPNHGSVNRRVRGPKWCGYRHPDHVNYFTPATLSKLLVRCGFHVGRIPARDAFPLDDNMWIVARRASE